MMCHRAGWSESPCVGPTNTVITYVYNQPSELPGIDTFHYCNAHSNEVAEEYLNGRFSELVNYRAETLVS